MKLNKINQILSDGFIKPKLSDIKVGDLVYYWQGVEGHGGYKSYCVVAEIIVGRPVGTTEIKGYWNRDKKVALRHFRSDGMMHLNDIFKVV